MTKFLKIALCSACTLLSTLNSYAERQPLDKIVAVIDRNVILQSEFEARLEQVILNARASNMAVPELSVLKQQVIDFLISEQLQLQTARRVGFNVTDEQVNQTVEQIREANNLTPAQLDAQLQLDGLTMSGLREKLRRDMTIQQIQQGMVQQRIFISPLEIENFLKSADAQFWISPEYHLGHILIALPQAASADEIASAKAKADALVSDIRKGKPFADVAIAESKGPAALQGGDLGWRKTSDLPSLFADIVPSLEVAGLSAPFRSPAGFHILKLYEKRGDEQKTEEQADVRHILIKPSAILSDAEAKEKLTKIRQEIIDGADFAKKAKEYSEDIGSMLSGGGLGWSKPSMFVPAFAKVVQTLPVGEISKPFQSRFGWHIVQVKERRQEDITEALLQDKAARILTSRRFEDELAIWLRELRDDAFVDIRL